MNMYNTINTEFNEMDFTTVENWEEACQSRETYLAWRDAWRVEYKALSRLITRAKGTRKENRYEYRRPGVNDVKRRTIIGRNPNHDSDERIQPLIDRMSQQAFHMMVVRHKAKKAACANRDATLAEAA